MSKYQYKVREQDGKLLIRREASKRIMVLDGYEKRCFLNLVLRTEYQDAVTKEYALDNIWNALMARATDLYTWKDKK